MTLATLEKKDRLLQDGDALPYEIVNTESTANVMIICEHAGKSIPSALGTLGVSRGDLDKHIALDIGAAQVARSLAKKLNAPLILQTYSRLVIDCNRPLSSCELIPQVSDSVVIPGNLNLSEACQQARISEIYTPFHHAIMDVLEKHPRKAIFAIHSFTPVLNGIPRPWEVGFLYRRDEATSKALAKSIATAHPELHLGFNEPYNIDNASDYFVPYIGEKLDIAHSLIEIRNDQIDTPEGQQKWSKIVYSCIDNFIQEPLDVS